MRCNNIKTYDIRPEHRLKILHVEARHEEQALNGQPTDVDFHFGFAVEVINPGELPIAYLTDVR